MRREVAPSRPQASLAVTPTILIVCGCFIAPWNILSLSSLNSKRKVTMI